jgi:hypothetical protein
VAMVAVVVVVVAVALALVVLEMGSSKILLSNASSPSRIGSREPV